MELKLIKNIRILKEGKEPFLPFPLWRHFGFGDKSDEPLQIGLLLPSLPLKM